MSKCSICSNDAMLRCSECSNALYCSKICQSNDWSDHSTKCVPISEQLKPQKQQKGRDVDFYIKNLALILVPVYITLISSVFLVKLITPTSSYYGTGTV
jgi:hypothetical protein